MLKTSLDVLLYLSNYGGELDYDWLADFQVPIEDFVVACAESDKQNNVSFKPKDLDPILARLTNCFEDVRNSLQENVLILNGDKTMYTVSGSPQQLAKLEPIQFHVGDATVSVSKEIEKRESQLPVTCILYQSQGISPGV